MQSVVIPDSVTFIGGGAFVMSNISSVVIGNGITEIRGSTFQYCGNLKSVKIGNSVTNIQNNAFFGCNRN